MSYSVAAALIALGLAVVPAYLFRARTAGVRCGAFAVRPDGIPVFLEAEQSQYLAVARICYRLPRGPLAAKFRLTVLKQAQPVWSMRFALDEADVNRGALVERQVQIGRFDIQRDGDYVLHIAPEASSDPRVHVRSVELFSRLRKPHPLALAVSQLLIISGLVALSVRAALG